MNLLVKVFLSEAILNWIDHPGLIVTWETVFLLKRWTVSVVLLELERVDVSKVMSVSHESSQQHGQTHCLVLGSSNFSGGHTRSEVQIAENGCDFSLKIVATSSSQSWWKLERSAIFLSSEISVPTRVDT